MDRIVDQETSIITDAGSLSRWIHRYRRFAKPHTKAGPMSGAMGYSVPGAIGAKLARPEQEAVAFVGDGGFMMTGQEMVTAVEQGLTIRVIVCDNSVHGSILAGQDKTFGAGHDIATVLRSPDFAAVARAYGAEACTVRRRTISRRPSAQCAMSTAPRSCISSPTSAILPPMAKDVRPFTDAD